MDVFVTAAVRRTAGWGGGQRAKCAGIQTVSHAVEVSAWELIGRTHLGPLELRSTSCKDTARSTGKGSLPRW